MIPIKDNIPSRSTPLVTFGLIALNVLVYWFEVRLPEPQLERFVGNWGFSALHFQIALRSSHYAAAFVPIFTSMFLHAGWLHIGGNMLFLYVFGDNVEDRLGHVRFLLFYLGCGMVAALVQASIAPWSNVPMIGASGAIAAVLGGYFVMFPYARVLTLIPIFLIFPIVPLRATWFLGIWIVMQVINGSMAMGTQSALGGVAWLAHVSGFFTGLATVKFLRRW